MKDIKTLIYESRESEEGKDVMNPDYGKYDEYSAAELFEDTLAEEDITLEGFNFWNEKEVAICLYGDWRKTHLMAAHLMAQKGWLMISQQDFQENPDEASDWGWCVQRYISTMYCADSYDELLRRYSTTFKKYTEKFKKTPHTREIKYMVMRAMR